MIVLFLVAMSPATAPGPLLQAVPAVVRPIETGQIEGRVLYPSCMGPPTMKVCAEDLAGGTICTEAVLADEEGYRYAMDLPEGKYRIFASAPDMPGYKAYYSKAVRCGLWERCKDHSPIDVVVDSNSTHQNIDPMDWADDQNEQPSWMY